MASKVELANTALANIRAPSINSFTEESTEAQYVRLFYPKVKNSMFQLHNWNFVNSEKPLVRLSNVTLFDWGYVYQYPADCVRINYLKSPVNQVLTPEVGYALRPQYDDNLYNDDENRQLIVPYEVKIINNVRVIGTNVPDLWIDYRIDTDDPNKYPPLFYDAFTWQLGADLAIPIIGGDVGRAERKNATSIARETLMNAIADDLNETKQRNSGKMRESDLILIRG